MVKCTNTDTLCRRVWGVPRRLVDAGGEDGEFEEHSGLSTLRPQQEQDPWSARATVQLQSHPVPH
jgi:hypothetical protein